MHFGNFWFCFPNLLLFPSLSWLRQLPVALPRKPVLDMQATIFLKKQRLDGKRAQKATSAGIHTQIDCHLQPSYSWSCPLTAKLSSEISCKKAKGITRNLLRNNEKLTLALKVSSQSKINFASYSLGQ